MNAKNTVTNLALLGLIGGVTVLTSGCWEIIAGIALFADDDPTYEYGDGAVPDPTVDFTTQSLSGDLGPRTFEGGVYMESGYRGASFAELTINAHDSVQDWRVMAQLYIDGGLSHPDLVPGAVLTFSSATPDYGGSRLNVSLLGCSGAAPDDSDWDFDSHADQVTVEVQEGSTPDTRLLHFVGTWSDGSIVDGTVEYQVR